MLKRWLDPLLLLIGIASGLFYIYSSQQATPIQPGASVIPVPSVAGLNIPVAQNPDPSNGTTPAPPPLQDVDAIMVIDNSGSMFGYTCVTRDPIPAQDRNQMRIRSADIIIAALAADLKPRETSLGIVSFGTTVNLVSQLRQLSNEPGDPVRAQLSAAIQNPSCDGDTNIVGALRVAQEELNSERHNPNNIRAIIFLTDGVPTRGGGEPEIRQVLDALQADNILLFTVLLGDEPGLDAFGRFWQTEANTRPNVEFERLMAADQMVDVYQNIKIRLDQRGDGPDQKLLPGSNVVVNIPPNVAQVILTVVKPAVGTQVLLTDSAGVNACQRPPDQCRLLQNNSTIDVFIVNRPESGDWIVSSANGEEVTVLQPEIKSIYTVQLLQPDAQQSLSVDAPTDIVVQVLDETTRSPLAGPFELTGSYRLLGTPPAMATPLNLTRTAADPMQYQATIPAGIFADLSSYIFAFQAQDSVGLRSTEVTYQLDAGYVPSIVSVTARHRVYVDEENTLNVTVANPESADGQPVPMIPHSVSNNSAIRFTAQTSNTFQATLKPLKKPGQHTINVVYAGKTQMGRDFRDQQSIQITVEERFLTILLRNLAAIIAILTLVYLVYRYILIPYTCLVPCAQKLGLAPQGYIRIQPDGQLPYAQQKVGDLLRRQRRLLRLTLGPECDVPLSTSSATTALLDDDTDALPPPRPRTGWRERLWGKPPLAVIGRRFRAETFIQEHPSGAPKLFTKYPNETPLVNNTIEFSLEELYKHNEF